MTTHEARRDDLDLLHSVSEVFAAQVEATTRALGGRIERWNGTLLCDPGSPHRYRNLSVPLRSLSAEEVDALAVRLVAFYGRPDSWVVASMFPLPGEAHDLVVDWVEELMLHPGGPIANDDIAPLRIRDVMTPADMQCFEETWARAYEKPHLLEPGAARYDERILGNGQRLWIGSLDGEAVATAGSYCHGGLNLVRAITTLHAFRGRGIGAAMTRHAMAVSDVPRFLNAEIGAEALYARLGFQTVSTFQFWRHVAGAGPDNGRISPPVS